MNFIELSGGDQPFDLLELGVDHVDGGGITLRLGEGLTRTVLSVLAVVMSVLGAALNQDQAERHGGYRQHSPSDG